MVRFVLVLNFLIALTASVWGQSSLSEGSSLNLGHSSDIGYQLSLKYDNLTPLKLDWLPAIDISPNAKIIIGFDDKLSNETLSEAQILLIRNAYLQAAGFERDRRLGSPYGVNIIGGFIPISTLGDHTSINYLIARAGVNLNYRKFDKNFNARDNGHAAELNFSLRLDQNLVLNNQVQSRLHISSFQQMFFRALGGRFEKSSNAKVMVDILAGAGIYLDILNDKGPYRSLTRTDPVTGEKITIKKKKSGKRLRLILSEVGVRWNIVDPITTDTTEVVYSTGLNYSF